MRQESPRLKLASSPPGSATWVYLEDDGRLTVEWYDYGQEAQRSIGGDVAFLLHVG